MSNKILKVERKPSKPAQHPDPKNQDEAARKLLLHMREKLLAEVMEKPIPESLMVTPDIGDEADQAGDEASREVSILLTARNKQKLLAIEEALEKIAEGTYGMCEECGERIGSGRLKAMPLARFCVSCQSRLEKEMTQQRKEEEELRRQQFPSEIEREEMD